jgi:glycosyltransferase involved in cell wall biosynthesis
MRIALLIYGSLDTTSGGYLYDRKLVETLQRQGDQVEIISLPQYNYPHHLIDNLSARLFQRLRRVQLDILLQDELCHPSLFWLNRRLRGQIHCPILSIVHHLRSSEQRPAWQNCLYRLVESLYLSSVDGFIFNSQTTRSAVAAILQANPCVRPSLHPRPGAYTRPYVIATPAGDQFNPQIDESEITRRALQAGPLRLLFVGNVIPRKGLHTLLEALRQLPAKMITLTVAGNLQVDKVYTHALYRQVARHRLADRVQFCGPLDNDALIAQLKSSHLLVVPSTYEGYGIVYLEGMGFGLPAMATTAGAATEIITHGQDGYLIQPGNATTLASYLAELASDRQRLLVMSLAARRRYLAHPTWAQAGERIRNFLLTFVQ